ncbi:(2Fe-2S)-binding protein [Pseudokineococcus basanitobsidens]|uniref:(2Fe-2S)-binding protein n=1 Tax=Pseudokineococcus basanitobsidens TaxID=1926649 RepID=A0ABU8RGS4_9ACTN
MSPPPVGAVPPPVDGPLPPGAAPGERLGRALAGTPAVAGWRVLRVGPLPAAPGWVTLRDALAPAAVDRWVAVAQAGLGRLRTTGPGGHPGPVPPQVAPTYVLGWVLDALAWAGGVPYGLVRRVPPLGLQRVGVHRAAPLGQVDAVVLLAPAGTGPTDDREHDGRGDDASAAALGAGLAAAGRAVEAAWRPPVRVGSRQRWGLLADAVDDVLAATGAARGDAAAGVADADAVLRGAPEPLRGRTRATADPGRGVAAWTRERRSCCFAYAVDRALVCSTCPRLRRRG